VAFKQALWHPVESTGCGFHIAVAYQQDNDIISAVREWISAQPQFILN
jgi:hypothetical protein